VIQFTNGKKVAASQGSTAAWASWKGSRLSEQTLRSA
jgi:hypothetical protein